MGCFSTLIFVAGAIFMMVSLLRWFEQITDAVDGQNWNRVTVLLSFPLATWLYESRVVAGRPVPVARHEPVRGFGKVSLEKKETTGQTENGEQARRLHEDAKATPEPGELPPIAQPLNEPPPGTPKEFLGMPKIPPKKKSAIDPEKLAKMRQKMRDQGMLPPESSDSSQ